MTRRSGREHQPTPVSSAEGARPQDECRAEDSAITLRRRLHECVFIEDTITGENSEAQHFPSDVVLLSPESRCSHCKCGGNSSIDDYQSAYSVEAGTAPMSPTLPHETKGAKQQRLHDTHTALNHAITELNRKLQDALLAGTGSHRETIDEVNNELSKFRKECNEALGLADRLQTDAMRRSFISTGVDKSAANARQAHLEMKIAHLTSLFAASEEQSNLQVQQTKALAALRNDIADCEAAIRTTAGVYHLATERLATSAAADASGE